MSTNDKVLSEAAPILTSKAATATDKAVSLNVTPTPAGVVPATPDPGPLPMPGTSMSGGTKTVSPDLPATYSPGGTLKKP